MRLRFALLSVGVATLVAPGAASADFLHTVVPGESLTSIAAADGLSVSQLAAANGLSPTAQLLTGSGIQIPPQLAGGVASSGASPTTSGTPATAGVSSSAAAPSSSGSYVVQPGDTLTAIAARAGMSVDQLAAANGLNPLGLLPSGAVLSLSGGGVSSSGSPSAPTTSSASSGDGDGDSDDPGTTSSGSSGSYVVQPGDTLTAIAARAGMTVDQLASANGLNPLGVLPSGAVLNLAGAGGAPSAQPVSSSVATSQPVGAAAEGSPVNPPYPTSQTVSSSEIGSIAAANGVPPALAQAIAYQESGFNNGAVSPSDARGVMQILPGTWNYIQQNLVAGAPPLAPASASDNVRGGVLLLHSLLNATGGNAALAAAGYYQGLPSVQANGLYPSTQQYVNNVLALQQRFNGGG